MALVALVALGALAALIKALQGIQDKFVRVLTLAERFLFIFCSFYTLFQKLFALTAISFDNFVFICFYNFDDIHVIYSYDTNIMYITSANISHSWTT